MTSANIARPASICRSDCSSAASIGTIPQYHTSADNLSFIKPRHLLESCRVIARTIGVIENDAVYRNTAPKCEPQLGKRGLYRRVGGENIAAENMAMLWALNFSDGDHSLLDIAERAKLPFEIVLRAARLLKAHGLLTAAPRPADR